MASGKLYNLAKMNTATTGTGTITLSTAVSGFLSFADAGATNGEVVTYVIEEGANREIGYGTYTSSGTTLTRNVLKSTNSDSAISLSGSATVGITAARENFLEWFADIDANGFDLGMDDNTGINDDSGNETVRFRKTSSAVNYVEILNTETTVGPQISAAGDDTDIDLRLAGKGTGGLVAAFKNATGLGIKDSDSSHNLLISTSSNLSANRTLTIVPGDADRTLTIPGNVSLTAPTRQIFTSAGTWTKPTGCRSIWVWCQGAGGGGAGADGAASSASCASGGGSGGLAIKWIDVSAISSETVTIGAAGAGGAAGQNDGSAGGTSSFGAHCSADGGEGGDSAPAGTVLTFRNGGAGGGATGGDTNGGGFAGTLGLRSNGGATLSGQGGSSIFGSGGVGGSNSVGSAGTGYGAGGGAGASNSADTTDRAGGDGAPGVVYVWEFY